MTNPSGQREDPTKTRKQNKKVDEEIEESFPASDPPAFAGGKSFVGAPQDRETPPEQTGQTGSEIKPKRK